MKVFNDLNHVKNLPDSYAKANNSNNYKILQTEKISVDRLQYQAELALKMLDIDMDLSEATEEEKQLFSLTLDLYGAMVNQPRGVATDEQYRLMIKSKIMQSLSNGTLDSVIRAICLTFNCSPQEISIRESEKPGMIYIDAIPLTTINKAGFTAAQSIQIIKRLIPSGVGIESFSFDGTFEFAANESDMSVDGSTKGFTDIESNMNNENATGGYLGTTYDGSDQSLPI